MWHINFNNSILSTCDTICPVFTTKFGSARLNLHIFAIVVAGILQELPQLRFQASRADNERWCWSASNHCSEESYHWNCHVKCLCTRRHTPSHKETLLYPQPSLFGGFFCCCSNQRRSLFQILLLFAPTYFLETNCTSLLFSVTAHIQSQHIAVHKTIKEQNGTDFLRVDCVRDKKI